MTRFVASCQTASPCWQRENRAAPSVVVEGYLVVGNLDEPSNTPGLASFTVSMLSRGTTHRTFAEINETIESVAASIGFSSDRHITNFSTKSLAEDLDLVLEVLADELRSPRSPRRTSIVCAASDLPRWPTRK